MTALLMEGVSHAFGGVTAVDNIDLAIANGEVVCLLGPSGCGKTTTLRIAAGLERLQRGRVMVAGKEVAGPGIDVAPEMRGVGVVFQDYALFPHLSVLDNVRYGLNGLAAAERRRIALEMLDLVSMADFAAKYPHVLSGGEQQRVALARALAPRPRLMLLDEPFGNLDARLRDQVRDDSQSALKAVDASTLMVTHDPEEAMVMADRIAVMRRGRIVQVGRPVDLYCRPANSFIAAFFGQVNRLRGRADGNRVETPLGALAAPGIADGAAVEVVIRPEALGVDARAAGDGIAATVSASRVLGPSTVLDLVLEPGGAVYHSRVPGCDGPSEGAMVRVRIDRHHAYVFAAGADD